jgi:hypothetical protein
MKLLEKPEKQKSLGLMSWTNGDTLNNYRQKSLVSNKKQIKW